MDTPTTPDTFALTIGSYLQALPLAALVVDENERIVLGNPVAAALFGANLVGRPLVTVLRQPPVAEAMAAARATGDRQMARILHQDGPRDTILMLNVAQVPLPVQYGRGFLLCFDDLTEREAAAQMRRDFVANVSHELRTPLTALLGFIETLQGPARNDPAAQGRFLGIMASEAGRMNRLVQDLLSLSQVEAQERIRPAGEVELCGLIASTLRGLAPLGESVQVTLGHEGLETPCVIPGDADQIRQVLTNLIENGIKYGGKYGGIDGRVTVSLTRQDRDATLRGPAVRIAVHDSGPGIEEIHIPRLTERFYRIDNHRSRAMGGTGLGLAIVKHIVNRHRGRLRIESVAGQGSTFSVILPA